MAWALPPLNPLRAFEAAARLGTMTAAAAEMNVTQVAVSRQIASLEDALRARLFERGHRSVALTPAGETLFIVVTKSFRELQNAAESISGRKHKHVLKVCGYSNFTMRWLIPRLHRFHARHADIDIQLRSSMDAVDFERSDLDVAIRSGDGHWPQWDCVELAPIELIPVCSPSLFSRSALSRFPSELKKKALLHSLARPDDWSHWLRAQNMPGIDPHSGITFDNGSLAYQAAIEGVGVAIAQKVLVLDDLRSGKLIAPWDAAVSSGESYYFVTPKTRLAPKVVAFRNWLREEARAQIA